MHCSAPWAPFALLPALLLLAPVPAGAVIEGNFGYDRPIPSTTWFGTANPDALAADRAYLAGMRPHHAGALTMSRDYLQDPAASSPALKQLAYAIKVNQAFEVAMLDDVQAQLDQPPVQLPFGIRLQPMAVEGNAQRMMFRYEPIPGPFSAVTPVNERDVQFAKAMIVHHQGAVDMARDYLVNPAARNGFLGLFNVDVRTDQAQEIALMHRIIAAYPGNPDAVQVDASMIHGMEGMAGHGQHGAAAAVSADPHAGHAAPSAPARVSQADPHAAHTAPASTTPAPRPRASVARPAARATGAAPAPTKPASNPHAGHEDHSKHNH